MQVLGSILRFLFAWIDGIVAKVITLVYNLLMDLANLTLYSENIVKVIGQRIGILLGIFMLFRLSVSLINYMISPERFSDNKQGGGALIKNIIISLVLLATVNTIFETAYSVQQKIVSSQIIEKIFFGETSQTKMDIGYFLYTGFFTPNLEVIPNCNEMWDPTFDLANSQCNQDLGGIVETNALNSIHDARNNLDMSQIFSNYDVVMANEGGAFKGKLLFNYTPIISTAAGIVTLLIMISFSMELAKRAIKLLFLQIVAPVPIIFNMDTGKGKDVFQKWYKQCFNTYISVFIRLLAIDFAVFIIVLLKGEFSNVFQDKLGVNIFIIIGCLLFAKEVPKLIEDMLGIKLDGMSLRPLKKFQDNALFGKQITSLGAAGLAGGAAMGANMVSRFRQGMNEKGFAKVWDMSLGTLASGVAGGLSATTRGTIGAFKGQKFSQTYQGAYRGALTARNNRNDRIESEITSLDIMGEKANQMLGMPTTAQRQDSSVKIYDEFVSSGEAAVSISENEIQKYANKIRLDNTTAISQVDDSAANPYAAALRAAGINSSTFSTLGELREAMSDSTRYDATVRAALNSEYERIKGQAESAYRDYATNGSVGLHRSREFSFIDAADINGQTAMAHITNVNDIFSKNKNDDVFVKNGITNVNGSNVKDVTKKVKYESTSIKNSGAYRRAHKIQQQAAKEKK